MVSKLFRLMAYIKQCIHLGLVSFQIHQRVIYLKVIVVWFHLKLWQMSQKSKDYKLLHFEFFIMDFHLWFFFFFFFFFVLFFFFNEVSAYFICDFIIHQKTLPETLSDPGKLPRKNTSFTEAFMKKTKANFLSDYRIFCLLRQLLHQIRQS